MTEQTDDSLVHTGETDDISIYTEAAYLAYAVSVVKGRALPSVEDGQKPVQRRILFAMKELGLTSTSKPVKSARVVGNVLGMLHPHGDSSVYEASVRMAQDFMLRYPLIDGQGNFGSRDGDGAAAMRYTEMRLSPIADLLLSELDRGTVDFKANYDGAFQEPVMLPARLPLLLLNGASGIAVGMATEIPPHNLREVGNAALALLDGEDPLPHVTGPDFPGGGQLISSAAEVTQAYSTGRGSFRLRARWEVEHMARGQWRVIVTELPYGVSVEGIIAEINAITDPKPRKGKKSPDQDQLVLKQALISLFDWKNESGSQIRLIIDPKTSKVSVDEMMTFLLLNTNMECSFSMNMVMIGADGKPAQKGLRTVIEEWVGFRRGTVFRRCVFDLDKVTKRIHILEGRMLAFIYIDEVIRIIRESEDAKQDLMLKLNLSEIQAEDILEIRLRQLAGLEGIKLERELSELRAEADRLNGIIGSEQRLKTLVRKELQADIDKYGDDRRTLVEPVERAAASARAFVADEPITIMLSKHGWLRSRQGHDVDESTLAWKQGDEKFTVIEARTVGHLAIVDTNGRAYSIDTSTIPGGKGDGVPITSLLEFQNGGKIVHALCGAAEDQFLFAGANGYGFIAPFSSLVGRAKAGKAFMTVESGEKIFEPLNVSGGTHLAAFSEDGKMLAFPVTEMKVLTGGGKGVMIMDTDKLEQITLFDGESIIVKTSKGNDKTITGADLSKHIIRRAKKGCKVDTPSASSNTKKPDTAIKVNSVNSTAPVKESSPVSATQKFKF